MDINKTFTATVNRISATAEGITLPVGTRHHFNIERGDTVIFEIKQIIKKESETQKSKRNMPLPLIGHGTLQSNLRGFPEIAEYYAIDTLPTARYICQGAEIRHSSFMETECLAVAV